MAALPSQKYCELCWFALLLVLRGLWKDLSLAEKCEWCWDKQNSGLFHSLHFNTCIPLVLLFLLCAMVGIFKEAKGLLFLWMGERHSNRTKNPVWSGTVNCSQYSLSSHKHAGYPTSELSNLFRQPHTRALVHCLIVHLLNC